MTPDREYQRFVISSLLLLIFDITASVLLYSSLSLLLQLNCYCINESKSHQSTAAPFEVRIILCVYT